MGYVGEIIAEEGFLLGGVKVHKTSEMETLRECMDLMDTYTLINLEAGRKPRLGEIRKV